MRAERRPDSDCTSDGSGRWRYHWASDSRSPVRRASPTQVRSRNRRRHPIRRTMGAPQKENRRRLPAPAPAPAPMLMPILSSPSRTTTSRTATTPAHRISTTPKPTRSTAMTKKETTATRGTRLIRTPSSKKNRPITKAQWGMPLHLHQKLTETFLSKHHTSLPTAPARLPSTTGRRSTKPTNRRR